MADIKALASGSTGNCYFVSDYNTTIMIECGISINQIKKGCGFKLHGVQACLVSHEH